MVELIKINRKYSDNFRVMPIKFYPLAIKVFTIFPEIVMLL